MTKSEYIAFCINQLKPKTFDNDESEVPPKPDDFDNGNDFSKKPDENGDNDEGAIDFVVEHLFWFEPGATVPMICRRNNLPEDVVQKCIDELIEDGDVEAATLTLRSDVHGEKTFGGFKLTSDFRERLARDIEELEAQLAIEAGEKRV